MKRSNSSIQSSFDESCYTDLIHIIESKSFKLKIKSISENFFNLKQELFIRNKILELLNNEYHKSKNDKKAFAEIRIKGSSRYDLSIVNINPEISNFNIEFKYQFGGDLNQMKNSYELIDQDLIKKKSDLFILIIAEFNPASKNKLDSIWRIKTNLSRYVKSIDKWKINLNSVIENYFPKLKKETFEFRIKSSSIKMIYYFHLIRIK